MFDLNQSGITVILHPQYKNEASSLKASLQALGLDDHFILLSSGTTGGGLKGYALSRAALFKNAEAVNQHYNLTSDDVWGLSLPEYHVGGLSIYFRAHLLGHTPVDLRPWDPHPWAQKIESEHVSITTLVPTQLFDLVRLKIRAPRVLKYLIIGGDFLSSELEAEAFALGWPIIRTFGMSEVCSQLASAKDSSKVLEVLPIHSAKVTPDGRLKVKSQALFTLEFIWTHTLKVRWAKEMCDQEGHYLTNDRARISGTTMEHLGRFDDQVKISGHLVNVLALREIVSTYALKNGIYGAVEISLQDDERTGKKIVLQILPTVSLEKLQELADALRPIRIDEVQEVESFNRTDLGKLRK